MADSRDDGLALERPASVVDPATLVVNQHGELHRIHNPDRPALVLSLLDELLGAVQPRAPGEYDQAWVHVLRRPDPLLESFHRLSSASTRSLASARPARQDAEGVESLPIGLRVSRMASEEPLDRDTLSAMKVSDLRQLCSDHDLLVSGKKDELVDRLLGIEAPPKEAPKPSREPTEDIDDAIDRLIARVSGEGPDEPESKPEEPDPELEEEPLEAEIVEAELVEPEPEEPDPEPEEEPETVEEDPWFSGVIPSEASDELLLDDAEEEEPSMVIVLPSIEGLKKNWRPISAIAVVVILVGATAFYLIQQDHHGDCRDRPPVLLQALNRGQHYDHRGLLFLSIIEQ